ncbi:hypothetical protein J6590_077446 [Homalodisca vitripennis]|nr:hypothetical protein J6590_077446 [Homalodisca vitripennis]
MVMPFATAQPTLEQQDKGYDQLVDPCAPNGLKAANKSRLITIDIHYRERPASTLLLPEAGRDGIICIPVTRPALTHPRLRGTGLKFVTRSIPPFRGRTEGDHKRRPVEMQRWSADSIEIADWQKNVKRDGDNNRTKSHITNIVALKIEPCKIELLFCH